MYAHRVTRMVCGALALGCAIAAIGFGWTANVDATIAAIGTAGLAALGFVIFW